MRALPLLLALCLPVWSSAAPQRSSRNKLLDAAAVYTEQYHEAFTSIVAEERYVQRLQPGLGDRARRRTLRSDVMLLRGVDGEHGWFFFRDVFEVDGEAVSGERGRLESWLRQSRDAFVQRARALALEQARYNLGNIVRTINVPLVALEFLLPRNQQRFRFRMTNQETVSGTHVMTVTYEERRRPTMIRTPEGDDVEARGRFWIEAGTGRVFRTELRTGERDRHQVRATIVVTYEPNERLRMLVPVAMEESYSAGTEEIAGSATYSNFRRFETDARIIR